MLFSPKCDSDKNVNLGAVKLSCYKFGNCASHFKLAENKDTSWFFKCFKICAKRTIIIILQNSWKLPVNLKIDIFLKLK